MRLATIRQKVSGLVAKNAFAKDTAVLVSGTAGAQLLLVAGSPLLTRLYTPDDFGVLAVFSTLLAIFSVVACFRYELAIPMPERDEDAASLVMVSLLVACTFSLCLTVFLYFGGEWALELVALSSIAPYRMLLPFGVLFISLYSVFSFWAIRKKQYTAMAYTKLAQAAATILIQAACFVWGGLALVVGLIIGQGVGGSSLGRAFFSSLSNGRVSRESMMRVAKQHKRFPMFSTWSGLFGVAGLHLPPLLFATLFGAGVAGFYILAQRVLAMPVTIVGQAVSKVFLSGAADAYRNGTIGAKVERVHTALVIIAMPPFLLLFLMGGDLFEFVFGGPWRDAGEMASLMSPWLFLVFSISPLSILYEVMNKQHYGLYFQSALLAIRVTAIFYGAYFLGDALEVIKIFSIGSAVAWLALLGWIFISTGVSVNRMISVYLVSFFLSGLCWSPAFIDFPYIGNAPIADAMVSVAFVVLYVFFYFRKFSNR